MFHKILNFILPPLCPLCREYIVTAQTLCQSCWKGIQFISTPFCEQCAYPFPFGDHNLMKCGKCLQDPPLYHHTRAAFKYDAHTKKLLLAFKHGDATYLTPLLGNWLYAAGTDLFPQVDCIIPVPLHWTRLLKRGYNQAELLAKEISRHAKLPLYNHILKRNRRTVSQGHLSTLEREHNVRNAFKIHPQNATLIQNQKILLIDDVMASGITLHYCTNALLKAGAQEVNILVLAKTVKGL